MDTIQIIRGNPRLKSYKIYNNSLSYNYSIKKFQANLNIKHLYYDNPIMESVFIEDNKVIIMDDNQREFQQFNIEANLGLRSLTIGNLRDFLSLNVALGYNNYRSKGNIYTHTYDNFYYNIMGILSYKNVMFMGQFRKNHNTLYGETIQKGENVTAFMAAYRYKRLQIGAAVLFPFTNNYRTGSERMSTVAPVTSWDYVKEAGRMFTIRLAYNFEFGRKHNAGKKNLNNQDKDAGIINTNR